MALPSTTLGPADSRVDPHKDRLTSVAPADVPLFRFGLRHLFVFVAAICALLAVLASLGALPALAVLLAVTVVVMHVFATALGTKLRSRTEQDQFRQQATHAKIDEPNALAS